MLTTIHTKWLPRSAHRRAASQGERRTGPVRTDEVGAWASRPDAGPAGAEVGLARASVPPVIGPSPPGAPADDPAWPRPLGIDGARLIAAGHLDPRHPDPAPAAALRRIAAPLVERAFAADAGRRDRMILLTSPAPREGRSSVAASLALCLARDHPVLLVDGDPERAGVADLFGIRSHPGLGDALADPEVALEGLIVPTELDHLALLAPGAARPDLLGLLASARAAELMRALVTGNPRRLILIESPPLSRGEGRALALFAGQVVLVVEAGETPRSSIDAALEALGERQNLYLLLAGASSTEALLRR